MKTRESGTISPNKLPCECQTKVPTKPHCDTPLYSLICCTEIPSPTKCSSFYRVCVCVYFMRGCSANFYILFVCFWLFVWFTAFYHYPSCRPLCCIIHCVALSLYACIYVYDFMYVSIHVQMSLYYKVLNFTTCTYLCIIMYVHTYRPVFLTAGI